MHFDLLRNLKAGGGVFSDLSVDGSYLLHTFDPGILPVGDYVLVPYDSQVHGQTVCFHAPDKGIYAGFGEYAKPAGMDGHDFIEMHTGNWIQDSKACVLVGEEISMSTPNPHVGSATPALLHSDDAMTLLRKTWGDRQGLTATITESFS